MPTSRAAIIFVNFDLSICDFCSTKTNLTEGNLTWKVIIFVGYSYFRTDPIHGLSKFWKSGLNFQDFVLNYGKSLQISVFPAFSGY